MTMLDHISTFRSLHAGPDLLVLPNAWDVGSALIIEQAGAKAIATTSAGVSWALGYQDGNMLPPKMLATLAAKIADVIHVPLTVDVEGGYSDDVIKVGENLKLIIDAGAAGINIEDGIDTPDLLVRKIEQIRTVAQNRGVDLFINARTDVYLNSIGPKENRVKETLARAARYHSAGADGIFIPGLCDLKDIQAITSSINIPVNVMALPDLPTARELSECGVRRLSSGGSIAQIIWNQTAVISKLFLETGSVRVVAAEPMGYANMQKLFKR